MTKPTLRARLAAALAAFRRPEITTELRVPITAGRVTSLELTPGTKATATLPGRPQYAPSISRLEVIAYGGGGGGGGSCSTTARTPSAAPGAGSGSTAGSSIAQPQPARKKKRRR